MGKKKIILLVIILIILLIFIYAAFSLKREVIPNIKPIGGDKDSHGCLIGAGYSWNETDNACVREWEKLNHYCAKNQRNAEVCMDLYEPVCGWFNSSIECIKYPCAQTYSNFCFACADEKVEYWRAGECPK